MSLPAVLSPTGQQPPPHPHPIPSEAEVGRKWKGGREREGDGGRESLPSQAVSTFYIYPNPLIDLRGKTPD